MSYRDESSHPSLASILFLFAPQLRLSKDLVKAFDAYVGPNKRSTLEYSDIAYCITGKSVVTLRMMYSVFLAVQG